MSTWRMQDEIRRRLAEICCWCGHPVHDGVCGVTTGRILWVIPWLVCVCAHPKKEGRP